MTDGYVIAELRKRECLILVLRIKSDWFIKRKTVYLSTYVLSKDSTSGSALTYVVSRCRKMTNKSEECGRVVA